MPFGRQHLKLVRLPISPPPLWVNCTSITKFRGLARAGVEEPGLLFPGEQRRVNKGAIASKCRRTGDSQAARPMFRNSHVARAPGFRLHPEQRRRFFGLLAIRLNLGNLNAFVPIKCSLSALAI